MATKAEDENGSERTPGARPRKRKRPPSGGGMPSKLTPETEAKILEWIRKGCFVTVAVRAVGVGLTTFKRWMRRKDQRGRDFQKAVEQAKAGARAEAEADVFKGDRIAWLRLGPGRDHGVDEPGWTERPTTARVEHTGAGGGPIEHGIRAKVEIDAISVVLDPVARRLACELLERHSELDARPAVTGGARPVCEQGAVEVSAPPREAQPPAG